MSCVKEEGHRLRHNVIGGEKSVMVDKIAAAPPARPNGPASSSNRTPPRRRRRPPRRCKTGPNVAQAAERQDDADRDLFDRELFYAIQPRDRLASLIARYRDMFAARPA